MTAVSLCSAKEISKSVVQCTKYIRKNIIQIKHIFLLINSMLNLHYRVEILKHPVYQGRQHFKQSVTECNRGTFG